MSNTNNHINYIEFPLRDVSVTKAFYETCFGWVFQDWGPDYISFSGAGVEGGFNGESKRPVAEPGVLVVLYSNDLGKVLAKVKEAGGVIKQDIYEFPGGKRFHFEDPNGNELAIWSDK
ncbi:VOC family protein [Kiloniella majae]|uniref:VOC family protein n=1 Tax=Kiloniella majae TaxID=1938558 RepID=UPI000A278D8B|nr:VOC family protein [Kiloniella majae]